MSNQIAARQMGTGNRLIKKLGKCLMFLYTVASFVSHSSYFSLSFYSFTLYAFVLLGLFNFVFNRGLRIGNLHFIWYSVFSVFSLVWVVVLELYWPNSEWFSTFYHMIIVLALSLSFAQFLESRKDIRLLCYGYMLGAVLLMAFLAIDGRLYEDERLGTTLMGNANTFADIYMMAAIMVFWLALNGKNFWEKLLFWVAIVVIFYGLLLSGGRKFILIPFVLLYIVLFLRRDEQRRTHVLRYTLLVAGLFVGVIWLMMNNETIYKSAGIRMQYLFNMLKGEGKVGASNVLRTQLRNLAVFRGFESPVWGHGFDAFKNLALRERQFYAYSHNNWAEMWYNYGLIGVAVYYGFYVKLVTALWKHRKTVQDLAVFGMACVISLFIYEYGAVSYFEYQNQILLCVAAAILRICAQERLVEDGKTENID